MPLTQINADRIALIDSLDLYEVPEDAVVANPGNVSNAISSLSSGQTLVLEDGDYSIGKIAECDESVTVMARNQHKARVTAGAGDTIAMMDGARIGRILFRGLFIEGSQRSAFMTLSEKPPYRVDFLDCVVDGGYDHATGTGRDSKWGLMGHRWDGYVARSRIQNIHREHASYLHSMAGDCLWYDVVARRCGRTAIQHAGRNNEAGYAPYQIALVKVFVDDCGLKDGGSAITLGGCESVYLQDIESGIGRDTDFKAAYMARHPQKKVFGTGHFVNWDDKGRQDKTKVVEFAGTNWFWSAPDSGAADSVQIRNADEIVVGGELHVYRDNRTAIDVAGGTKFAAVGNPVIDIQGKLVIQ